MRSFIAIEITQEAKLAIESLQRELRRVDPAVAWTRPENIHLTLKFLGEIDEKHVPAIIEQCSGEVRGMSPFRLELSYPGVFPNLRHPRVLWVGLTGDLEPLTKLQAAIDEAMERLGFKRENTVFRPHLTIGRVRGGRNLHEMLARMEMYDLPPASFMIRDLILYQSVLSPNGSKYTEISRIAFRKRGRN